VDGLLYSSIILCFGYTSSYFGTDQRQGKRRQATVVHELLGLVVTARMSRARAHAGAAEFLLLKLYKLHMYHVIDIMVVFVSHG
jgi:hypothetical protein